LKAGARFLGSGGRASPPFLFLGKGLAKIEKFATIYNTQYNMVKKFLSFIWEISKIVVIAALIVLPIRYFLFQPFLVKGQSMEPNFENGDYLIIDEISYRFRSPQRGEVIVFRYPQNPSQRFIKRIIGLPGETVEIKDGKVTIYAPAYQSIGSEDKQGTPQVLDESNYIYPSQTLGDIQMVLGENEYFVLGDNRDFSFDSRRFGPLPQDKIIGRVIFRAWPFATLTKIEAPVY
jgi:signal peptidase I